MNKKKTSSYYFHIAISLILLSVLLFAFHFLIFKNFENTMYYSTMNICFIPLNTLFVSVVFENLVNQREKKEKMSKLNMLVGLFFVEMGFEVLKILSDGDDKIEDILKETHFSKDLGQFLISYDYKLNLEVIDKDALSNLFTKNINLITTLVSNETVLDKETFFNLLIAILGFRGSLVFRNNKTFSNKDMNNISKSLSKIYKTLVLLWYEYSDYLYSVRPNAYSGDLFINPFGKNSI